MQLTRDSSCHVGQEDVRRIMLWDEGPESDRLGTAQLTNTSRHSRNGISCGSSTSTSATSGGRTPTAWGSSSSRPSLPASPPTPRSRNARRNSDRQNARIEHDKALLRVMTSVMRDDTELFKQFMDNASFKRWLTDTVFSLAYEPASAR